jgi:hypothetical protein
MVLRVASLVLGSSSHFFTRHARETLAYVFKRDGRDERSARIRVVCAARSKEVVVARSLIPSFLFVVVGFTGFASVACANSEGSGLVTFKSDAHHDGVPIGDPFDAGEPLSDVGTGTPPPTHDSGHGGGGPVDTGSSSGGGYDTGSFGGPVDTGTSSGGGPVDTGTGSPPPPGGGSDSTCGAMSTYADCADCCGTNHPDGYTGFITALADCACAPSVCGSTCASTFCASTPAAPTASCGSCLDAAQSGACNSAIATACGPGGPCAPYADCVTAQCSALP